MFESIFCTCVELPCAGLLKSSALVKTLVLLANREVMFVEVFLVQGSITASNGGKQHIHECMVHVYVHVIHVHHCQYLHSYPLKLVPLRLQT